MGVDKLDGEGDGFFHLFDWKRKSQKKSVSGRGSSPEVAKLGRKIDNLQTNELPLFDEEANVAASSSKGSDRGGCSSVSGEGTTGTRAPGLVAKLMGLDFMPASVASESYLAPLYDSQPLQHDYQRIRRPEFDINNRLNHIPVRAEGYCMKQQDSRSKSVPISHTQRHQVEASPQGSARSRLATNQKLPSIYNPRFVPLPNRVHVREATITDQQECKTSKRGKIQPSRPSSRCLNSIKGTGFSSPTSGMSGTNLANVEVKGESMSLSVQAKMNIQRRIGSDTGNKSTLAQKDLGHCKLNRSFKSRTQESKHQKKSSAASTSDVLRKNNQKQNCKANQDNVAKKPLVHMKDVSSGKKNIVNNKLSRNSNIGHSKELSGTADLQKEVLLTGRKNLSLKRSVIEGGKHQEKKMSTDNVIVGRHKRHIQHNRNNNTDIVSFTFSSPIETSRKSQIFSEVDKLVKGNGHCVDTRTGRVALDAISANLSSLESNDFADDTLGVIVEQKLRKLTSGAHSPFLKEGSKATSPLIMPVSDFGNPGAAPAEAEEKFKPGKHKLSCFLDHDLSPIGGHALREVEGLDSNNYDWQKQAGHHLQSPLSVLETSFSNEYSISSESTDGDKMCSSIQAESVISMNCTNKVPSIEDELELSGFHCSAVTETLNEDHTLEISGKVQSDEYIFELDIFKDMSSSIVSILKDLGSYQIACCLKTLDPVLFEELECRECSVTDGKDVDCGLGRKVLIDCMKECLDKKYNCYFQAGYRAWTKGRALFGNGVLEEICKEILGWKSMGEWMVDELIDNDMSTHLGRWTNFEIEAFEVGMDIESVIFSSMVDEVATDFLIGNHSV